MQNDLISRSALIAEHCDGCDAITHGLCDHDVCGAAQLIMEAPAVDAVEVVSCLDCKHWHSETGWCNHHSHFITDDGEACHPWESANWKTFEENDFCSYGERRADDDRQRKTD